MGKRSGRLKAPFGMVVIDDGKRSGVVVLKFNLFYWWCIGVRLCFHDLKVKLYG